MSTAGLKSSVDGLSKAWEPLKVWQPFYAGGKIALSPSGDSFYCEYDGNVKVVSLDGSGEKVSTLISQEDVDFNERIACFAVHPNGKEIVAATEKFNLIHYKPSDRPVNDEDEGLNLEVVRTIKAHRMPILSMDFDPTGTLVVTGSADRTVRVWDITKGYCTHSFSTHQDILKWVKFHPIADRLQVFSGSDDHSICVFDLRENKCTAQFKEHFSLATSFALTPDGYTMVTAGRDKVLNFYEMRANEHVKTMPLMEEIEAVVVLPSAASIEVLRAADYAAEKPGMYTHVVITAGAQGVLKFFAMTLKGRDLSSFKFEVLFQTILSSLGASNVNVSEEMKALRAVSNLLLNEKRNELVAVTKDFNICFFSFERLAELAKTAVRASKNAGDSVDAKFLVGERPDRCIVSSYGDILDLVRIPDLASPGDQYGANGALKFRLAVVSNSPQLRLIDENLRCDVFDGHTDIILAADVSPDGEWLVTTSKDKTLRLWNLVTKTCVAVGIGHTDSVGAVCISSNVATYASRKAFAITGAGDKILKRWPLALHALAASGSAAAVLKALAPSHNVRAHEKDINCVAMSPNDALIASASQDKTVRLWKADDLSAVATLRGHKRGVWKVLFSPIDKLVVSCSGDRTVRLWSATDYSAVRTLEGHTGSVLSARFVNHGTQLISSSADGLLRLWTLRTGECEATLEEHEDRVWALETLNVIDVPGEEKAYAEEAAASSARLENAALAARLFISAGSDARIILWKDVTAEKESAMLAEAEERLVAEQSLRNDIFHRRYGKALAAAITLNMPTRTLEVLMAILEEVNPGRREAIIAQITAAGEVDINDPIALEAAVDRLFFDSDIAHRLDSYIGDLEEELVRKLLTFVREWNTNSRHAYVSQLLISSVMRVIRAQKLLEWKDVRELLPGLAAYTSRHFARLTRLEQAAHFLDFMVARIALSPMDRLDDLVVPAVSVVTDSEEVAPVSKKSRKE